MIITALATAPDLLLHAAVYAGDVLAAIAPPAGLLDRVGEKGIEAAAAGRSVGIAVAVFLIIMAVWKARGGLAATVAALAVAALFIWGLSNVNNSKVQKQITDELVDSAPVAQMIDPGEPA